MARTLRCYGHLLCTVAGLPGSVQAVERAADGGAAMDRLLPEPAHFTYKTYRLGLHREAAGERRPQWLLIGRLQALRPGRMSRRLPDWCDLPTEFEPSTSTGRVQRLPVLRQLSPPGVVSFNHDTAGPTSACSCNDRIHNGLGPACAKTRPTESIQSGSATSSPRRLRSAWPSSEMGLRRPAVRRRRQGPRRLNAFFSC